MGKGVSKMSLLIGRGGRKDKIVEMRIKLCYDDLQERGGGGPLI